MFYVQLILAGIATGAIYSLAGMGVVLTYKGTGVFNFAYGAIAMIVAYCFWELRTGWGWPLWLAGPGALVGARAGLGFLFGRVVVPALGRRGGGAVREQRGTPG